MTKTPFPTDPVLLVDDDKDLLRSVAFILREGGVNNLVQCDDSREVKAVLESQAFEVVLLDLNMPHLSGRDLLPTIVQHDPDLPVIILTGVDEVQTAVQCMRAGAFDYMVKPVGEEVLLAVVRRAGDVREMRRENTLLKQQLLATELAHPEAFSHIITQSRAMQAIFRYVEAVAVTPQPILITGETGTGKELVAKAIHIASERVGGFVPVNIAGVDSSAFSDTLFGHIRGAFTGAIEPRKGLIERASGGTAFLDEIGDLDHNIQVKLLRLTQEREYLPLGSDVPKKTDARIIVATNKDLVALQEAGQFREDLFYRLRAHQVHIPPLRERAEDIPLLTDYFLAQAARELGVRKPTPPRELFTLLSAHHYPGNVRELQSMIYNAVSTHKSGILSMDTFRTVVKSVPTKHKAEEEATEQALFDHAQPLPTIRDAEDNLIVEALRRTNGNQTMAAELLGVTRQTLIRHLKRIKE